MAGVHLLDGSQKDSGCNLEGLLPSRPAGKMRCPNPFSMYSIGTPARWHLDTIWLPS